MRFLWLAILCGIMSLAIPIMPVNAARDPQFCFENMTDLCGLSSGNPTEIFSGIMTPLEEQVPGFAMLIFWGGIMAIIWFKTENIMLLGIIGVFVNATIVGISATGQGIGLLLLGVANGILLFQLFRQRISIFS